MLTAAHGEGEGRPMVNVYISVVRCCSVAGKFVHAVIKQTTGSNANQ